MANINMGSIMSKVKSYSKTDECKKRMKKYLDNCRRDDLSFLESGAKLVTEETMKLLCETLVDMLKNAARESNLPESVLRHFNSLYYTEPYYDEENQFYICNVAFSDDLSRMSLLITKGKHKGERTGEGIDDIVALFDTGYGEPTEISNVYGRWENQNADIASLIHREGTHFMEETVNNFNRFFGDDYRVYATLLTYD